MLSNVDAQGLTNRSVDNFTRRHLLLTTMRLAIGIWGKSGSTSIFIQDRCSSELSSTHMRCREEYTQKNAGTTHNPEDVA